MGKDERALTVRSSFRETATQRSSEEFVFNVFDIHNIILFSTNLLQYSRVQQIMAFTDKMKINVLSSVGQTVTRCEEESVGCDRKVRKILR